MRTWADLSLCNTLCKGCCLDSFGGFVLVEDGQKLRIWRSLIYYNWGDSIFRRGSHFTYKKPEVTGNVLLWMVGVISYQEIGHSGIQGLLVLFKNDIFCIRNSAASVYSEYQWNMQYAYKVKVGNVDIVSTQISNIFRTALINTDMYYICSFCKHMTKVLNCHYFPLIYGNIFIHIRSEITFQPNFPLSHSGVLVQVVLLPMQMQHNYNNAD